MLQACLDAAGWRRLSEVDGRFTQAERIALAVRVAREVAALHQEGRVVGDIDPWCIRHKRNHAWLMPTGELRLDSPFAAPELRRGATPTQASDVYALGCLTYQLVSGRRPPSRFDLAMLHAARRHGWHWIEPLEGALASKPEERFADAAAFVAALEKLEGPPPNAPAYSRSLAVTSAAWALGAVTVALSIQLGAVGGAAVLLAMAGVAWWRDRRRSKQDVAAEQDATPLPVHAAPSRLASNNSR